MMDKYCCKIGSIADTNQKTVWKDFLSQSKFFQFVDVSKWKIVVLDKESDFTPVIQRKLGK
jgi:hypothetical protein